MSVMVSTVPDDTSDASGPEKKNSSSSSENRPVTTCDREREHHRDDG